MSEWKECTIGDVLILKRGYDLPTAKRKKGKYPVVSASGISGYHNEYKVQGPGVTTGRSGTLGKSFYIRSDFWPLNTSLYVEDFKGNNPRFISYLLENVGLENFNAGSGVPTLNRNHVHTISICFPSLSYQEKVSSIIGSIEDKVELNLKINKTLEEIAMTLYKHWFVDFGPFQKGEFVESELGKIPKGWAVEELGEELNLKYGKALKKADRIKGEIPVYGSSGVVGYHNESLVHGPGIVVGRKGNVGTVMWSNDDFYPIDTTYYIENMGYLSLYYIYFCLKQINFLSLGSDSAVPGINRNTLLKQKIIVPDRSSMKNFNKLSIRLFNQIKYNKIENQQLKIIRDYLLPKLLSGEIDLSEAEEKAEEVL